jgi:hypothetical protein
MSTWEQLTLTCPRCGGGFDVKAATGLHITRLPRVRAQALRGELHRFGCPTCDQRIELRQPVLYTDFERHHWIEVQPADELPRWRELADECAARFDQALRHGAPMVRPLADAFRVRLVFGYDELREKLLLWDAGLDDVEIERVKLEMLRRDLTLIGPEDRLLVHRVDGRVLAMRGAGGEIIVELSGTRPQPIELPPPFVSVTTRVGRFAHC